MRNILVGAFALLLSACASVPALAQECEATWAHVQAQANAYEVSFVELDPARRNAVGRWYNELPPETNFEFTHIYFASSRVFTGLVFRVGDCVVAITRITQEALEAVVPQA